MKQRLLVLGILLLLPLYAAAAASPVGLWRTIDDDTGKAKSIVRIYQDNGKLYGKVVKLLNRPPDDQNPTCTKCEGSRKGEPIKGMVIMWNMKKDGDVWDDGTILDPAKGETYDCKIWLDDNKLKVRGYWGIFYRTQTWQPVTKAELQ